MEKKFTIKHIRTGKEYKMTEEDWIKFKKENPKANEYEMEGVAQWKKETVSAQVELDKYLALKTICGIINILGYIVLGFGVLGCIYFFTEGSNSYFTGIGLLILCFVIALPLFAFVNSIQVFIDIEYNTRKTREALERQ